MNEIGLSLDTVWMLLAAMLVFWMQPGFALCEAGFTRSKNTANILMKNFVDFMFGSLLFFFLGFGFMFGSEGAGFIGMPNWGDLSFYKGDLPVEGFLIFETVFCATSATIVSGAMAERTKFSMYLIYSAVISLFHQVLDVSHLQRSHLAVHLSRRRSLDVGWGLALQRRSRQLHDDYLRRRVPRFCRFSHCA